MRVEGGVRPQDRAFPFLTGLGVFLGLPLGSLLPGPAYVPAFVLALLLGTLRIRRGRPRWLGVRLTLAAAGAVALGLLIGLTIAQAMSRISASIVCLAEFVVLPGLLSGLLAYIFQQWAEKGRAALRLTSFVGLGMVLAGTAMVAWATLTPHPGPTGTGALIVFLVGVGVLVPGVAFLIISVFPGR